MKKLLAIPMLTLLAGLGFSTTASAVECSDLVWSAERLETNPNIPNLCLEVVERGGGTFAKLHARVIRQGVNSTVVRYQLPDGSWSDSERVFPQGFMAQIAGEDVRIADLNPRQEVNVYINQAGNFTVPAPAPAPAAAPEPAPAPAPAPEPEPEPEPEMLPSTASQVHLLALLGTLLVLLGGAAHVVRTRV